MTPDRRRREWKRVHPALHNWTILGCYNSKSEAQAQENRLARERNCEASPGGDGKAIVKWYVYYFEF